MRKKLIDLMIAAQDLITLSRKADFLIANDVVPVVRCKDCKHGIWDEGEQMWECLLSVDLDGDADTYAMFHEYNDGEHFCSYGERKDNDI